MRIKDGEIFQVISKISEHYKNNIYNRHIRKAFAHITMDKGQWDRIAQLIDNIEYYRYDGYPLDDLYEYILAFAQFVYKARHEVQPNLRNLLSGSAGVSLDAGRGSLSSGSESAGEKVLRDMAINNFGANIGVLADMLNDLYIKTVYRDKQAHTENMPVYEQMPELRQIGSLLT
ncbi:MAG: hypothetical protein K9L68_07660 [Spirochaetales bacterium]|nr:hypothetical protein [Spirochaetales bacterium]MCF7938458.1 hypothetical protein [Spirochaetales bacterium]